MKISREQAGLIYLVFSVVAGLICLRLLWGSSDHLLQFAAAVGCGFAAYLLGREGTRRRTPVFRDLNAISDLAKRYHIPVAIYLRRFHEDSGGWSNEEEIALGLGDYALFVAIGRPGEKLPTQGAFRLYVSDPEWRDRVMELLSMASLVFMRWAPGGHLGWELEQVNRMNMLYRTAFVVPRLPPGTNLDEFLPEQVSQLIDVKALQVHLQESQALLTLRDDGGVSIHRLPKEIDDQDDRKPFEHLVIALAEELRLSSLDRSKRVALRRLYGRTERIVLIVGRILVVIPSLAVAFVAVILVDLFTPFDILPLSWDLDLILSALGSAVLASVVVLFLGAALISRLTGRS
ncbi:hypothetical protein [Candidatus Thiodiazotropha sp. CDECU1]|uniref:hypothetical protein n=1 Tax=Candidatus Thiodiazotropha sp. CDECU1 TaxID=3065865 RepID=UPI0029317843|nr:hypothetical protein [Candidatus Thiodiazotropha sp. CDECU1]